jgi:hypothetical protein
VHVDLIESLRCPHRHADGWLVARADCVVNRQIVRGTIGCPTCGSEWELHDGVLDVSGGPDVASPPLVAAPGPPPTEERVRAEALRAAALLDLRDARGVVVLVGEAAWSADALLAQATISRAIQPEMNRQFQLQYLSRNTSTQVVGTTANYIEVRKYEIAYGRMFTAREDDGKQRVAVVGSNVLEKLGIENPAALIDQPVRIMRASCARISSALVTRAAFGKAPRGPAPTRPLTLPPLVVLS